MHRCTAKKLTQAGIIAAAYTALIMLLPGPSFGYFQLRAAEALAVLPYFFPAAVPGLTVGCLVSNLLSPYGLVDVVCGTAATALAAVLTMRVRGRWLAPLMPVLCNGTIVGGMLAWYETGFGPGFWQVFAVTGSLVALGELLTCYILGGLLLSALPRVGYFRRAIAPERLASYRGRLSRERP